MKNDKYILDGQLKIEGWEEELARCKEEEKEENKDGEEQEHKVLF